MGFGLDHLTHARERNKIVSLKNGTKKIGSNKRMAIKVTYSNEIIGLRKILYKYIHAFTL